MTKWHGENDFALFKSCVPISPQKIWQAFFELHKNKVYVKKEKVAIAKLQTIIKATFKLSNEKGFSLMSLRDLSQKTDMSMGSLYNYIGSKTQLAEMIHQFLPHMFNLCIGEYLNEEESSTVQLQKMIRGHIFITECLQPWFFFAYMETKHLSRSIKKLAKENELKSEVILENIIEQGKSEGVFLPIDTFLTAMMIKSLLQNWYVKHSKYQQKITSCEHYIQFIEQVIANHLRKH